MRNTRSAAMSCPKWGDQSTEIGSSLDFRHRWREIEGERICVPTRFCGLHATGMGDPAFPE